MSVADFASAIGNAVVPEKRRYKDGECAYWVGFMVCLSCRHEAEFVVPCDYNNVWPTEYEKCRKCGAVDMVPICGRDDWRVDMEAKS